MSVLANPKIDEPCTRIQLVIDAEVLRLHVIFDNRQEIFGLVGARVVGPRQDQIRDLPVLELRHPSLEVDSWRRDKERTVHHHPSR